MQLCQLERRAARSGKDSIGHAPGAHDDLANSVAGSLTLSLGQRAVGDSDGSTREDPQGVPNPRYAQRRAVGERAEALSTWVHAIEEERAGWVRLQISPCLLHS